MMRKPSGERRVKRSAAPSKRSTGAAGVRCNWRKSCSHWPSTELRRKVLSAWVLALSRACTKPSIPRQASSARMDMMNSATNTSIKVKPLERVGRWRAGASIKAMWRLFAIQ